MHLQDLRLKAHLDSFEKMALIMSKSHISRLDPTIEKLLFISHTKRISFCLSGLSLVSKENPLMNMEVKNFLGGHNGEHWGRAKKGANPLVILNPFMGGIFNV